MQARSGPAVAGRSPQMADDRTCRHLCPDLDYCPHRLVRRAGGSVADDDHRFAADAAHEPHRPGASRMHLLTDPAQQVDSAMAPTPPHGGRVEGGHHHMARPQRPDPAWFHPLLGGVWQEEADEECRDHKRVHPPTMGRSLPAAGPRTESSGNSGG